MHDNKLNNLNKMGKFLERQIVKMYIWDWHGEKLFEFPGFQNTKVATK